MVATGAVGSRPAGRLRLFRYEVRCWRGGSIPDLAEAAGGPRRLTTDPRAARRLLELVAQVPTPVWGRDELHAGEMWNSNSMIAWLIARSGLPTRGARAAARAAARRAGTRGSRRRRRPDTPAERPIGSREDGEQSRRRRTSSRPAGWKET